MTRMLRRKFIITAMLAVSIFLLVLLAVINIGNFTINSRRANQVLSNLVESEGRYTPPEEAPFPFRRKEAPAGGPWPRVSALPTVDDMLGARYFLARFDAEGTAVSVDMSHIYAVDGEAARELAETAYRRPAGSGQMGQFRFCVKRTAGGCFAVFLDISNQIRSITAVLTISVGVSAFCWAAMLLLVVLLSRRAIRPIAENIERQRQFVANAGHEIKTPLSIILINTDALELHLGANKWSRNIRTQTLRLNGLMQNLLTLAKMDEGAGRLAVSAFSADLLLEELLAPYYEIAAERQVSVRADLQPGVTLQANREGIAQLFSILLDNAVKYTPAGGAIAASLSLKDGAAVFQVRNTCVLPDDLDLERLFDRFYRCDSARTQKNGGCGIGLSAARAIAQAHGGTVTAEMEGGDVILFTVKLRCRPGTASEPV